MLPRVSAIEVSQGDYIYLNDTVDISRAIAWPDYKLAWCRGDYYGCNPPDQIIQITGFMYKYYIDPAVWHTGTYYRWDGQWNRGEYALAFTILPGERPDMATLKDDLKGRGDLASPNVTIEGPYHYLVARGDDPLITVRIARDDPAHLWMFGTTTSLLDYPMKKDGFDYSYQMNLNDTFSVNPGKYTGYLQFDGKNRLQDVFWDSISKCIDSPYDDDVVPDLAVNERNPQMVKATFENQIKNMQYSDDILIPVTMTVSEPSVVITELEQGNDKLWLTGRTTWSNGTPITLKLDEENYKLAQDIRLHTWTTTISGNLTELRAFSIAMPFEMKELYIGSHQIKMSVTKNNFTTDAYHDFRISGTYIMPTPTPEFRKVMTNSNGSPIVTMPTTIPVPQVVYTPIPSTYINSNGTVVVNVTPVETKATIKPVKANVTTNVAVVPTPTKDPNIQVGLSEWVAVAALIAAIGWRRKP